MNEDVNSQIKKLQDLLQAGVIDSNEYMAYVNRLLDPEHKDQYILPKGDTVGMEDNDNFCVYDDDDDDEDPYDTAPPVPDDLSYMYGPSTTSSSGNKGLIVLVVSLIILLVVALSVFALWKIMRSMLDDIPLHVPTDEPTATEIVADPDLTSEQIEAIDDAIWLADIYPRSRESLIEELVEWGHTREDAEFAVDNCGLDWNEQALRAAQNRLDYMAYSRDGLIEQLEYNGFSHNEAVYGVDATDTDWREQAPRMAEEYLDSGDFTRDELIDQLEYEGFSHEDAVYGVDEVGL